MKTASIPEGKSVVLFDGVCNFCNSSVNFIIDHDPAQHFVFTALQEPVGQQILQDFGLRTEDFDSIVLVKNGKIYQKSSAALQIARGLSGLWPLFFGFWIIPSFVRDVFYDILARNRYRWFGRQESCRMPTPELRARFLK
ncbi:Predicted thiol-disulfide oxidoreductase YuxK, DCC family [Flexibacter flexilis DSM 6793]|uniref:Predicted thiol-disulfide oxidoreductase YuxK, DCC family n=1 Tax=Flexibacter flexilis DSM 6793 TaxID=927664 RepID=A0A1I1DEK3_9BACT|nr:thiol-disulfide oxidoreductase DCC family protein [Flexibacter flexilis]SFB73341.1 Predicted thiol-disulfide oxidoreductase YuxK, DCC family [Flexibacter flexilis DSM 6793]